MDEKRILQEDGYLDIALGGLPSETSHIRYTASPQTLDGSGTGR